VAELVGVVARPTDEHRFLRRRGSAGFDDLENARQLQFRSIAKAGVVHLVGGDDLQRPDAARQPSG
jgi:hypothetical protein